LQNENSLEDGERSFKRDYPIRYKVMIQTQQALQAQNPTKTNVKVICGNDGTLGAEALKKNHKGKLQLKVLDIAHAMPQHVAANTTSSPADAYRSTGKGPCKPLPAVPKGKN